MPMKNVQKLITIILSKKKDKWDTNYVKRFIDCDGCNKYYKEAYEMTDYKNTLHHNFNTMFLDGELKNDDDKYDCTICDSSLDQYFVESHLKAKKHLDNIAKDEDGNKSKDVTKSEDENKDEDETRDENITKYSKRI